MVQVNFLMTKCRSCGRWAKGKHYQLLLAATPFMLVFYGALVAALVYYFSQVAYEGPSTVIVAFIIFCFFFVPGLVLLLYLRDPKYLCPECRRKEDFADWKREMEVAKGANLRPGATEREFIQAKLADNPLARGVVARYSEKTRALPPWFFVDSVIAAANMERAGNFDGAIASYEALGLYDEAGRVRGSKNVVKTVTVDLNELIDQIRTGGLALNYRCPSCGAGITIDSKSDAQGLRYCGYCGTVIDIDTLNDLLRTALR